MFTWTVLSVIVDPSPFAIDPALLTAVGVVITALTGLIAGIAGLIVVLRREVKKVHTLVNANNSEQLRRIDQLVQVIAPTLPPTPAPLPTGVPPATVPVAEAKEKP